MLPVIETDRLILREVEKKDAKQIFACFSNANVTRYYGLEPFDSMEQAEKMIGWFKDQYHDKKGMRWGIERKDAKGIIIGTIGFNSWVPKHKRAEVGYEIHPNYWRNGYAFEALENVLSFGFEKLGLHRIGAVVFIENAASHQLLIKAGFQSEGILRRYMYQNGLPHDTRVYPILNEIVNE
ncbi:MULTISPECIES: GNAT family N-acetyltransferase [Bacillus amyloliquefaciens group]|uniref:GNAT family N-acetyltransferase n=1 Tax=Bacillus amyloliquefaciens group TaxID=1938374 RepID=UPI00057C032D|nr:MULTISPECIES: GNAT family protein [Bacillus amyloliquefaciens group]MEB3984777.1 GNAT family N-acetyltransferase [Bacillus velezensis]POR14931.1 N-acetyltransferase [Bacillus velezensis]QCE18557.1 N-acetyltransferase [Bacillus velezensis]UFK58751.1 GNAT family N-acetyltransferase [Bacillus amyloliquefaciens]